MTTDTELETWKQEWREETEPLPEWTRKIKRQNIRTMGAVVAICLCLAFSTFEARHSRSWFMAGMAAGIGFAGAVTGSYAWWVRRGSWRPTAQTTLAYAELAYRRALAKERILRFSFHFLVIATSLFAGFVAWNWKAFHVRDGGIAAAMGVECFYLKKMEHRKHRESEETNKLIEHMTK